MRTFVSLSSVFSVADFHATFLPRVFVRLRDGVAGLRAHDDRVAAIHETVEVHIRAEVGRVRA